MNLSVDDMNLVAAARRGERGALRRLAVSLDERLGNQDVDLDGAVMAWRAVKGGGRAPSRTMAAVDKGLGCLRRRFAAARSIPASAPPVTPAKQEEIPPALDHRPAA